MTRLLFCLLTLLFSLSGPAMGANGDFGRCTIAAKGDFGGGTTFSHFTDAKGLEGITGVSAKNLVSGDSMTINKISFGQGSNSFMAPTPGAIFVTDLPATASTGALGRIGVFGDRQSFVIQFSQEALLNNGIRASLGKPNNFTIPGGTTLEGTFTIRAR